MRTIAVVFLSLVVFACHDSETATTLDKTESTSYSGYVLETKYGYDGQSRVTSIWQRKGDVWSPDKVSIEYNGNVAVILTSPTTDPAYNQTTQVTLTLNDNGLTQRRIEYTHKIATITDYPPTEVFIYDTLDFQYDGSGLLLETNGHRYDSTWINETDNQVKRVASHALYTSQSGNVIAADEVVEYPIVIRQNGTTTLSGGSSHYQSVFNYTKQYPNKTDFKNTAVLNEFKQSFEPYLNSNYTHMADQIIRTSTDKNLDGVITFNNETTFNLERTYNGDGLLSSVKIPDHVQFTSVAYFYR